MSKPDYVNGPWFIEKTEQTENNLDLLLSAADDNRIGWIYNNKESESKLIAAAPEMLEALISAFKLLSDECGNCMSRHAKQDGKVCQCIIPVIKSVIEKASGMSIEEALK